MCLSLLFRSPIAGAVSIILFGGGFTAQLCAQLPSAVSTRLDFDDNVGPGNPDLTGMKVSLRLVASHKFHSVSLLDAGLLRFANNGTPYIASVGGGLDFPITLERFDGAPFSLISFAVAEGFLDDLLAEEGFVSATKIEIEAALVSGLTATLVYDLDVLRDGPRGVDDFESFAMNGDLRSITSVTFIGPVGNRRDAGFALDNLVVTTVVPEPPSTSLIIAALTMVGDTLATRHRNAQLKNGIAGPCLMLGASANDFVNITEVASLVGSNKAALR